MNDMYEFTVPMFIKLLGGLKGVMAKAQVFAKEHGISDEEFLKEALASDMFPLVKQIQIASDHAKGATARLAGIENPKYEDTETTFLELEARIDKTIDFLHSVPKEAFDSAATRQIVIPYIPGKYLVGLDYVREYAIPNFIFHVTIAYGIIRHKGVPIGKSDYVNGLTLSDLEQ